jgi:hypothetical protein
MMDRLERFENPLEAVLSALRGFQVGVWTALPAIIDTFDPMKMICTAQPAIQAQQTLPDNTKKWVNLPLLLDVPVVFPGGGGFSLTFPVAPGDEALVVFASRCIDGWWAYGGINPQAEFRMHDLSDGFAIVGVRSLPRVVTGGVNMLATQLRSDDGATVIEVRAGVVNVVSPNPMVFETPELRITGGLVIDYDTPSEHSIAEIISVYDTHTHKEVVTGADHSGIPDQIL